MIGKEIFTAAKENLENRSDRQVRLDFLAARRWFQWGDRWKVYDEPTRQGQIDAILGADPVVVEGGAFDFWASRRIISPKRLKAWRDSDEGFY